MARPAPSIDRAFAVLTYMAHNPGEGFTLSDLSRRLDLNKATAHAMLSALDQHGLVRRHPVDKTYTLGPALIELAAGVAPDEFHALEYARGEMTSLSEELGLVCAATGIVGEETAVLAVRVPTSLVPGAPGATIPAVGRRLPWAPPIGPVFAAWAPDEVAEAWLARASGGDASRYREHLAAIRKRGFDVGLTADTRDRVLQALSQLSEEASPQELRKLLAGIDDSDRSDVTTLDLGPANRVHNVHNVTAPVFGTDGGVVIILNVNGFGRPLRSREIQDYGRRLMTSGLLVTDAIHGTVPDDYPAITRKAVSRRSASRG